MDIPGACACHAIISDECRSTHGDEGALQESVRRISDHYRRIVDGWCIGKGAKIHIAITVERPRQNAEGK